MSSLAFDGFIYSPRYDIRIAKDSYSKYFEQESPQGMSSVLRAREDYFLRYGRYPEDEM